MRVPCHSRSLWCPRPSWILIQHFSSSTTKRHKRKKLQSTRIIQKGELFKLIRPQMVATIWFQLPVELNLLGEVRWENRRYRTLIHPEQLGWSLCSRKCKPRVDWTMSWFAVVWCESWLFRKENSSSRSDHKGSQLLISATCGAESAWWSKMRESEISHSNAEQLGWSLCSRKCKPRVFEAMSWCESHYTYSADLCEDCDRFNLACFADHSCRRSFRFWSSLLPTPRFMGAELNHPCRRIRHVSRVTWRGRPFFPRTPICSVRKLFEVLKVNCLPLEKGIGYFPHSIGCILQYQIFVSWKPFEFLSYQPIAFKTNF